MNEYRRVMQNSLVSSFMNYSVLFFLLPHP
ncbi:palindromic element RPE3 domain-containing protein [Rickettsia parkeri]|nr:palindromic element RPE3 domain-containing protein [Rickettsia parkeri]